MKISFETEFPLSEQELKELAYEISIAENTTSGEIKIHIEEFCKTNPLQRATQLFVELGLEHTIERNAIIIYFAFSDRKMAIYGDKGIHEKVHQEFWDSTLQKMKEAIKTSNLFNAIKIGIHDSAEKLSHFYPARKNDINELNNEISIG